MLGRDKPGIGFLFLGFDKLRALSYIGGDLGAGSPMHRIFRSYAV